MDGTVDNLHASWATNGGDTGTGIAIVDVGHPVAADGDTRLPVRYTLVASNSVAARRSNSLLALELSLFDPSYNYIAVEMNQDVVWKFVCCAGHCSGMSKDEFNNIGTVPPMSRRKLHC